MPQYQPVKLVSKTRKLLDTQKPAQIWEQYQDIIPRRLTGMVEEVAFRPNRPFDLAVAAGTRVYIFKADQGYELQRTISVFKDVVRCVQWRNDGNLIAASGDTKLIEVMRPTDSIAMRTLAGHKMSVRVCRWISSGTGASVSLFSASDDKSVKLWDLATGTCITTVNDAHSDYIRSGSAHPANPNIVITSSYDHTIKLWDMRTALDNRCVMSMDHTAPVECVVAHPSGSLLFSAGGTHVSVFDLIKGGKEFCPSMHNHQKTVTSVAYNSSTNTLISTGLDQMVKFYEPGQQGSYQVTYSIKSNSPVLKLAITREEDAICLGTSVNTVEVRRKQRKVDEQFQLSQDDLKNQVSRLNDDDFDDNNDDEEKPFFADDDEKVPDAEFFGFSSSDEEKDDSDINFNKRYVAPTKRRTANDYKAKLGDYSISTIRSSALPKYDKYLKDFKYHDALDLALKSGKIEAIMGVLEELKIRQVLREVLARRHDVSLHPLLSFLRDFLPRPQFTRLLLPIANIVLELYWDVLCCSTLTGNVMGEMLQAIKDEIKLQKEMQATLGMLDTLLYSSAVNNTNTPSSTVRAGQDILDNLTPVDNAAVVDTESDAEENDNSNNNNNGMDLQDMVIV